LREVRAPRNKKELQSLNGKIAALSRLISKATDRCIPFFDALKKGRILNGPQYARKLLMI